MRPLGIARRIVLVAGLITVATAAQASTLIDLSAGGSGTSNGAIYSWTAQQGTGAGAIEWFLRVHDNRRTQTRAIQMEDLVIKNITGVDYYQFLLDVNESSGHDRELISLDNVQIYVGGGLRYNSDVGANGDTSILLDYTLDSGSGTGDMLFHVPVSLFAGTLPSDNVNFYSLFNNSDAGFEEWALLQSDTAAVDNQAIVPEPASMLLLGTGLLLAARRLRKQ